ncbi:hypothetical protein REH65_31085 [Saccharopolyspora sp. ID03-671]|uniref:hypothetical protein n=1 Tax=Saccharopolyspora sp. ID03-671 TaxID=3073066 RepID=UPI00325643A0
MNTPEPPPDKRDRRDRDLSERTAGKWGIAALILALACCAGPLVIVAIASGALGALGAALGNPVVLATAGVILVAAITALLLHRHRRR